MTGATTAGLQRLLTGNQESSKYSTKIDGALNIGAPPWRAKIRIPQA